MKKTCVFISMIFLLIGILSIGGCSEKVPEIDSSIYHKEHGAMIEGVTSFLYRNGTKMQDDTLTSSKGMSGKGGVGQVHSNQSDCMVSVEFTDITQVFFLFDLQYLENVEMIAFWNYNENENTNVGCRNARILLSKDGTTYTDVCGVELERGTGIDGLKVSSVIDLGGCAARYVKIIFDKTSFNYGNQNRIGLSEVRFFRKSTELYAGSKIAATPILRKDNGGNPTFNGEEFNITNTNGLRYDGGEYYHGNIADTMYAVNNRYASFKFDLNGQYPLAEIEIFNYNEPGLLDYGIRKFELYYSQDGIEWDLQGEYEMPKASGSENEPATYRLHLQTEVNIRYVSIVPKDQQGNYGGGRVGLSEVNFYMGTGYGCVPAYEWDSRFSYYEGWSGADGIYSVNLQGGSFLPQDINSKLYFNFGDSIIGSVKEETDVRTGLYLNNNTYAIAQSNGNDWDMKFFSKPKGNSSDKPAMVKPSADSKYSYYWTSDCFVSNGKLYVFLTGIEPNPSDPLFNFKHTGMDMAVYDINEDGIDYASQRIITDHGSLYCQTEKATYYIGGGVYENTECNGVLNADGYIYIYGCKDQTTGVLNRSLIVARVKEENIEDFSKYEYFAGNGEWKSEITDSQPLFYGISTEFSVSQIQSGNHRGKYVVVYTPNTLSDKIAVRISDGLTEGFSKEKIIYVSDETYKIKGKGSYCYNAKAHPALSRKGELLISYNINGSDCFTYSDIYRPRFVTLKEIPNCSEDK